jgi:hypothetical protein
VIVIHKKMILEMAEKRRWFSKVFSDSQESRTDTDISWSDSDPEEETSKKLQVRKKLKIIQLLQTDKSSSWVTTINGNITPSKNNENPQLDGLSVPVSSDILLKSPVLGNTKLEEDSPILTPTYLSDSKEKSPIINRRRIIRKIKWRTKRKKEQKIVQDESADFSDSNFTIDSQSSPCKTQIEISPAKTELSQPCTIDPFPSQHSSDVVSDSLTSCSSETVSLYHQLPSKKKRLKKDGLAHQLQKVLSLHNTSLSIWQHEIFLSKSKGEEIQPNVSDVEIKFCVIKMWKEYGSTILECQGNANTNTKEVLYNFNNSQIENYNTFLIIVAVNNMTNVCFQTNSSYKMFPPYHTRLIKHVSKQTLCFINVSRLLPL